MGGAWAVPSLQATGVRGSLHDGFTLERLAVDEPGFALVATNVVVNPAHLSCSAGSIDLAQLSAASAIVTWAPSETKSPAEAPASLALPLSLRLRDVTIGELRLGERGQEPHVVRDVRLRGQADADAIRIEHASARYGPSEVELAGTLGAARPFPLSAHAELRSIVLDKPVQAVLDASGSLLDMALVARSDNATGRLDAQARITPFSPVPLAALSLTIADFEPDKWLPNVPAMRLAGTADLQPQPGRRLHPRRAVPVDQRLARTRRPPAPACAVGAGHAALVGRGARPRTRADRRRRRQRAGGRRPLRGRRDHRQGDLHGASTRRVSTRPRRPTQASGQLDFESGPGRQRFTGRATNARGLPVDLDFAVTVAGDVVDIERAIARLGEGRADVSGRIQLGQATAAQLRGEFHALDLSKFVAGVDTRLNGRLNVDGTLQPVRRGRAEVALSDSRLYGRPIEGRADLQLDGDRFDVDTELVSGDARLRASGGLGGGRELSFDIDSAAPRRPRRVARRQRLGAGQAGRHGAVAMASRPRPPAPALLLPGQQRIEKLDARLRGGLAPGRAARRRR